MDTSARRAAEHESERFDLIPTPVACEHQWHENDCGMRIREATRRVSKRWLHRPILWRALLVFLSVCSFTSAADGENSRLVVMLYPENSDGNPGNALVDEGIRSTFAAGSHERIEIYNEYLDISRSPGAAQQQLQAELLQQKFAGRKVDLVITGLSTALDFALKYRDQVFPGVPVVFLAVEQRELKARKLPPDVIGVPIKLDFAGTLDLALRLHPGTQHVFVVAGTAKFDAYWTDEAKKAFRAYEGQREVAYLTDLPMEALLNKVAHLPDRSILYYLHMMQDGSGKVVVPAEVLTRLAQAANAPLYGHVDTYVGRGVVGGRVVSLKAAGENAATLGLRILAGEKAERIGVQQTSENTSMFDWRQLRRWGISEASLPPGSVVRFKEATFWDLYRWQIIGLVSLCIIETLLLVRLYLQMLNRKRAEEELRESDARFRLMADAAPVLIWASGPDKGCTYFNKPWLEFTGRLLEKELGNGWAEGVHPDDFLECLEVYTTHFDARQPFQMEYRLRRHDGEYRWVLDQGAPRLTPNGEFAGYIGACTDVTDRRRAEEGLRTNQRELRVLTGRMLNSQEVERRRIARELHDDVNQSLALLSVELDLLAQKPEETGAQLGGRLHKLSAKVKQLSTSVHDLSHQLHPSKLEQLGLVAVVRGLCKELTQSQGLAIEFVHHDMPERLSDDAALCLYRIAQEALGNVIKHSDAHHARVELSGSAEAICLRIADDGVGFDSKLVTGRGGLGLVSIRERLHLVGGAITIDSGSSGGTRIEVRVPRSATGQLEEALTAHSATK